MSVDASPLVDALLERSRGRLAARDRLDALEDTGSAPTPATLTRQEPGVAEAQIEEALDNILSALAVRANRQTLRALRDGRMPAGELEVLMRAGLVIDTWTGGSPQASAVGSGVLTLLDEVCAAAALRLRGSLEDGHAD